MDSLFGCSDWRDLKTIQDHNDRADATISLFSDQLKAEFVTHMRMLGANNVLKYVLLHATNHPRGRDLMKEAMWNVEPSGTFAAHERDHPDQLVLVSPEPDLAPLRDRLWSEFAGREVRMKAIYDWLSGELYLRKHVHQIIRDYRKRKLLDCSGYDDRFAFGKNPVVHFPSQRPDEA